MSQYNFKWDMFSEAKKIFGALLTLWIITFYIAFWIGGITDTILPLLFFSLHLICLWIISIPIQYYTLYKK